MTLIHIEVHEIKLGLSPKYRIKLPAIPRVGETITLSDGHYQVNSIMHQPIDDVPDNWKDHFHYVIRMIVVNKFKE